MKVNANVRTANRLAIVLGALVVVLGDAITVFGERIVASMSR